MKMKKGIYFRQKSSFSGTYGVGWLKFLEICGLSKSCVVSL